jgi:hypothetical protein
MRSWPKTSFVEPVDILDQAKPIVAGLEDAESGDKYPRSKTVDASQSLHFWFVACLAVVGLYNVQAVARGWR